MQTSISRDHFLFLEEMGWAHWNNWIKIILLYTDYVYYIASTFYCTTLIRNIVNFSAKGALTPTNLEINRNFVIWFHLQIGRLK